MNIRNLIRSYLLEAFSPKSGGASSEITNLLQYLTPSKEEKAESIMSQWDDLIERFSNLIPHFLEVKNIQSDCDEDECISFIYENGHDNEFIDWIVDNFETFHFEDFDIPSWYYFRDVKMIHGTFVHFTQSADEIFQNGFKKGVSDMSILGMTTLIGDEYKKSVGYNFAYSIDDLKNIDSRRYGNECVQFDGVGIRCWHVIDKEYEVIFHPSDVVNIKRCNQNTF